MPRKGRIQFFLRQGTTNSQETTRIQEIFNVLRGYVLHNGQYQDRAMFDVMGALSIVLSRVTWKQPKTGYCDEYNTSSTTTVLKAVIKCDDGPQFEQALPLFFSKLEFFQLAQSNSSRYGTQWFFERYLF